MDSSGLPGLTHFSGYRTLTSTPSPGNAAQPALELPLEDPAVVAAGEALLSPPGMVTVEGIVKQVRFHSSQTGYTVMRVAISSQTNPKPLGSSPAAKAGGSKQPGAHPMRRKEVTVVGTMHHAMVGLCLKLSGEWITHPQYGEQLQAVEIVEMPPQHDMDVVAYLSGGVIPGVGHATAERLVNKFGAEILEILDSADAVGLLVGGGISRKTAEKIKSGWDSGREARIGSMFLREAGVAAALAQRVAESLGERTKEVVTCDPYAALKAFSLPLTKLDHLAATVDAPADLVSRAAAVMEHALAMAAAGEGHTFLPWDRLEQAAKDVLADLALQHGELRGLVE